MRRRERTNASGAALQPLHVAVALILCVIVPGSGWLLGDPELAWSMYAKSAAFRLHVEAITAGRRRTVAASALAQAATGSLRTALGGAENLKSSAAGPPLRHHLGSLTLLACQVTRAERVQLTLEERATLDAPLRTTRKEATCPLFAGSAGPVLPSAR